MAKKYDIVIVGGGNAGLGVSAVAAPAGKSIAFIEERDFGGTCPNRGCTPKKFLVAAAHALHEIEIAGIHGIAVGKPRLNWAKLIEREKAMVASLPETLGKVAAGRGDIYRGHGRFVGPQTVAVNDETIEGEHIVIATGSKPRPLPIEGAELMITSEEVLGEREQPSSVVFIGGGVIAMEFSHVYARAGTKVTILEALPRILPALDEDAVAEIRRESERIGIAIETGVRVSAIGRRDGHLQVRYQRGDQVQEIVADRVVNGAGRIANVDTLDLDAAGIRHDGVRIETDACLRSVSNPAIWVCGDAIVAAPQLSPLATYEGKLVGRNIVHGVNERPDYRSVPSCVYTVPAVASVGLTGAQAREQGLDVSININDMRDWFSGETYAETVAWAKVIVERGSGRILGAHIVGHSGEELIHLFALAMRHDITADRLTAGIYAFPTFSADIPSLVA